MRYFVTALVVAVGIALVPPRAHACDTATHAVATGPPVADTDATICRQGSTDATYELLMPIGQTSIDDAANATRTAYDDTGGAYAISIHNATNQCNWTDGMQGEDAVHRCVGWNNTSIALTIWRSPPETAYAMTAASDPTSGNANERMVGAILRCTSPVANALCHFVGDGLGFA